MSTGANKIMLKHNTGEWGLLQSELSKQVTGISNIVETMSTNTSAAQDPIANINNKFKLKGNS